MKEAADRQIKVPNAPKVEYDEEEEPA